MKLNFAIRFPFLASLMVASLNVQAANTDYFVPENGSKGNAEANQISQFLARENSISEQQAGFRTLLNQTLCRETVIDLLGSARDGHPADSLHQWTRRLYPDSDGSVTYVSPTTIPGTWHSIQFFMNHEAAVTLITPVRSTTFEFEAIPGSRGKINCEKMKKNIVKNKLNRLDRKKFFTDHEIIRLMKQNREKIGIIYVWSPKMGYSHSQKNGTGLDALTTIQEAAKLLKADTGLDVAIDYAVDSAIKADELAKFLAKPENKSRFTPGMSRPIQSIEVGMRGMSQHFPAILVYHKARIGRSMLPGISTAASYVEFIKRQIKDIQADLKAEEK